MDFDTLYNDNKEYVMYLLRNIFSKEDREDLAQNVWVIAWKKLDTIEAGKEKAFLKKIVYNVIGNYITTSNRKKELMNKLQLLAHSDRCDNTEEYLALMDFLENHLEKWEYKLVMMFLQNIPQRDMAAELHMSQNKVSSKLRMVLNKTRYIITHADALDRI